MRGRTFFRLAALGLALGAWPVAVVCQNLTPSDSPANGDYSAKVISLRGDVSVLRDSQRWALSQGDTIQMQQVVVSGADGHAMFQVSDGSTFEVFPYSTVVFRNNPPSWRELIDIIAGKIKVHIEHWGGLPNPQRVRTPTAVISVRGTVFDVVVDEDDATTDVAVEEGTVVVRHLLVPGNEKTLHSGESLRIYRNLPIARSRIDKGAVFERLVRGLNDAMTMVMMNPTTGRGGLGTPVPGAGSGNTKGGTVGPPPPPPPPPPPLP